MIPIIECVPNFSEGRDPLIIQSITNEIESVEAVRLLNVDPGKATNRTVVTFVGHHRQSWKQLSLLFERRENS